VTAEVQIWPALDDATEAALRTSIERFGVIVPVVHDQHGRILDGHHRTRLADELGVDYEVQVREVADENEFRAIARTLNADRRHLTIEQRREMVMALREDGHSHRAIAQALGTTKGAVQYDLEQLDAASSSTPERIVGLDGKSRPATQRQQFIEAAAARKLGKALAGIHGYCLGIEEFKLAPAIASARPEDIASWERLAGDAAVTLNKLKRALKEAR
jgi:ParB-like nuclease domain